MRWLSHLIKEIESDTHGFVLRGERYSSHPSGTAVSRTGNTAFTLLWLSHLTRIVSKPGQYRAPVFHTVYTLCPRIS